MIEELKNMFLDSEKLFKEVDDLVWKEDIQYIDALMLICDEKNINPDDLVRLELISPALESHLMTEGVLSGTLKQSAILPV